MLKMCFFCGKRPIVGKSVVRKGLPKKKGGTGSKIVRSSKRKFLPNLQKIRILLDNRPRRVYVCAQCIKQQDIQKA
ncbi:MAG: 50S ribosomal protein L28 [Candidatus Omnitrophica bacterium]|nr:50S ribosomal protein L28 [Candidatus Omnitrophota bacterium]